MKSGKQQKQTKITATVHILFRYVQLVPITFLLYKFSLLLVAACFTIFVLLFFCWQRQWVMSHLQMSSMEINNSNNNNNNNNNRTTTTACCLSGCNSSVIYYKSHNNNDNNNKNNKNTTALQLKLSIDRN